MTSRILEEKPAFLVAVADDEIRGDLLRHLGELASGVLHEVRNPLQSLRALMQVISQNLLTKEEIQALSLDILAQLDALDILLRDYQEISKPTAVQFSHVDGVTLCEGILRVIRSAAILKQIELDFCYPPALPLLYVDAARLRQVLLNLLTNAMQALEEKEGPRKIWVDVRQRNEWVIFSGSDNGCGIPADKLDRVFEKYYTTKRKGTGLGLAISRLIAEAHNGFLQAKSVEGKCSCFELGIPIINR